MHDDDLDTRTEIAIRPRTRAELEAEHGRVWDEQEVVREFSITAIIPPTIIARRHADGVVGTLLLQPRPRLYFRFRPTPDQL